MILVNNGKALINNSKLHINTPTFFIINSEIATFSAIVNTGFSLFTLEFSEPTQVNISWGDGTGDVFNTRTDETGRFLFDIGRIGTGTGTNSIPDPNPYVSNGKEYPNAQDRVISFYFNTDLLIRLSISGILIKSQKLHFPFYKFPNLESVNISDAKRTLGTNPFSGGAFSDIDMRNVINSKIKYFRITGSAEDDLFLSKRIPEAIFQIPIERLGIGGSKYHEHTFDENNMNLLGESGISATLRILEITAKFTDNQGLSEAPADPDFPNTGGLPGNFLKLTNLESLRFINYRVNLDWTQIPLVISQMTWLKEVSFNYSYKSSSGATFNIPSNFFENHTQLEILGLDNLIRHIPNMEFIENLSDTIQHISLRSNSNQARLNDSIMRCFALVKNKSLSEIVLSFETFAHVTAQIPSGTYQEPEDLDNPESPLEAIWVMRNIYNCTITYQE